MDDRAIGRGALPAASSGVGLAGPLLRTGRDERARPARARHRRGVRSDLGLADLHDRQLAAPHRPAGYRLDDRRRGRARRSRTRSTTSARFPRRHRCRTSIASPAGASTTSTGRASASGTCSERATPRGGEGAAVRLGRAPVRRHADAPAGAPAGRDARARDGRHAALGGARVPGPPRDAADVRLQERQVGDADRGPAAPRPVGYWEQHGYDEDAWVGARMASERPA